MPAADRIHVARQPILDLQQRVTGYELLYRADAADRSYVGGTTQASARVLSDALVGMGLETLTDGRRAFLNLSTEVLLSDASSLLDPKTVVLELLEDVRVTPDVVEVCRSLAARGYQLALDDFVPGSDAEQLLPHARYVKLDVLSLAPDVLAAHAPRLLAGGLTLLAEKVETPAMVATAAGLGCTLFQGYYFCRPHTMTMRPLSASQVTQMRLVAALLQPSASILQVEDLLKHDASLTYRILRCVNSAGYGVRREIRSIRDALLLVGLDQVRKWASLWALAGVNRGPAELATMTILRARTCELVGAALGHADHGAGYFLLGLCSLLDALLQHPMPQVIADLPLGAEIRAALLGEPTPARRVLDAVVLHERGAFDEAIAAGEPAGLDAGVLATAAAEALAWAHGVQTAARAA
ncbi:MAG: EAL and HDOD domain-containing protein [Vicinamibacterales bacterium]